MATYSIYQTKARLSEVLRIVKTRREVVITEHGKPIAKIVPFDHDDEESLEHRLERLTTSGQLVPATVSPGHDLASPWRKGRKPSAEGDSNALQRFLEDRDE